ncbi:hypothetical protein ACHHYP_09489 [Achlya hypogyna]|uniref:Uncharacterized protein n=1 Tax=Achlya hypogyna TaxID=1202772 RepID=A0A1V9YN76_ACHHY|nr:hypothetical protein ACHHYP_09489 [Achlya hypogyna]
MSKTRGWDWAQAALWAEDAKCAVRMVDVVFFEPDGGRPTRWLFASKHGAVAKKKDDHVTLASIRDRFARLSQHPKNTQRWVAYALLRSGARKLLDEAQFVDLFQTLEGPTRSRAGLVGLQAYVQPSAEPFGAIVAEYKAPKGVSLLRPASDVPTFSSRNAAAHDAKVTVGKLVAEFTVDDDQGLWLVHIPQTVVVAGNDAPLAQSQSLPSLAKADAAAKCAGDFCRMTSADLPGLYASAPPTPLPVADTGQRIKIGFNNVLLARATMPFLLARGGDSAAWLALDQAQRTELGRTNPTTFYKQVGVCANCNQIYAQLQLLRQTNFDVGPEKSLRKVKPSKKDKSNNQPTNHSNLQPSDPLVAFMADASQRDDDDAHESAFLAELGRQTQLLEPLSVRAPQDDSSPAPTPVPGKRRKPKPTKEPSGNQASGVLAQFEAEWHQVESANKTLVGDNARLAQQLAAAEVTLVQERKQWATDRALLQETNAVLEKQTKALGKRLASMQKEFADAMAEKDAAMEQRQVEASSSPPPVSRLLSPPCDLFDGERASSLGARPSTNQLGLIETIEQLSAQLEQEQRDRELDRQRLQATHRADLQRTQERHQIEAEAARVASRQQLGSIEELNTQLVATQHQLHVAQAQTKQAKASLLEAQLRASGLEDRLAATEATAAVPSVGSAVAHDAAVEKLQHKVEYLKAQLASEVRCKEELGSTVATLTANLESMKRERKKLSADLDEVHRKQLEKTAERHRTETDQLHGQLAALQAKVATLQANVTDLVADLAVARGKEDNAKLTAEKLAEEGARLHARIAELENTNDELQDAANGTKSSFDDAQRATMEATLRRLTHERQYLKSQMDGEARRREELETKLKELQGQLQDAAAAAKVDVAAAKQAAKEKEAVLAAANARLEEAQLLTNGELASTKHQLHEAKLALFQARETGNGDRAEVESQRAELAHLKTSLIGVKEELLKERERGKAASDRQAAAMTAIKAAVAQTETSKAAEVAALSADVALLRAQLAEAHAARAQLEAQLRQDLRKANGALVLQRAVLLATHRANSTLQRRWVHWVSQAAICRLRDAHAAKLRDALQAREAMWHERLATACDDVAEKAALEKELALAGLQEALTADASIARDAATAAHATALAELRAALEAQWQANTADLVRHHEKELEDMEASHVGAIDALQEAARASRAETDEELRRVVAAAAEREAALKLAAEADLAQSLRESEASHVDDMRTRHAAFELRLARLIAEHDEALVSAATTADACRREETARWCEVAGMTACDVEARQKCYGRAAVEAALVASATANADAQRALERTHADQVADIEQHWRTLLEAERQSHAVATQAQLAAFESKLNAELEMSRREMLEQKGNAVMATTAKWQRALAGTLPQAAPGEPRGGMTGMMADTTARIETEKKVWYDKGVADREAEWQKAAALIKQAQKEEVGGAAEHGAMTVQVDALERDSKQALQACQERFDLLLATKTKELNDERDAAIRAAKVASERAEQAAVAATAASVAQATERDITEVWQSRLAEAQLRSEQELRDACAETERRVEARAMAHLASEKTRWLNTKGEEVAALQMHLKTEHMEELHRELGVLRTTHEGHVRSLQADWAAKLEEAASQLQAAADSHLQERLRACEAAASKLHEEQMALVQEESEKLIDKVEVAMVQLKKQKEVRERMQQPVDKRVQTTESELQRVTRALEEAEDAAFDLQEEIGTLKKHHVFRHLLLLGSGVHKLQLLQSAKDAKAMEHQAEVRVLQEKLQATTNQLSSDLGHSQAECAKLEQVYGAVYDTLVNYKRDELVQHRSASNVVTNELSVLQAQIAQVVGAKAESEREVEKTQADLGALEDEISGIQFMKDGHVNQAQVARKRRLHQETEAMLETIDTKKAQIRGIESKLQELYSLQRAKEDEMKSLERHLVQILVEQQKQLLSLVTAVNRPSMG